MTESERIVLGDEGEGDSDDSDPVQFTGEASVAGSAAVSAGPSSFSHSTVAPGSSGAFRAPPGGTKAGGRAIRKPRSDTVKGVFREQAGKTLTGDPTEDDIREALALMKRAVAQGQMNYAENVPKFEAWLAKQDQARVAKAFGYDHLPPPLPAHLVHVVPPGAMARAGAPAVNNPVTQLTGMFKTPNQQRADEKNRNAMLASAQGRAFGAYPLFLNGVPFSCITRD